MQNADRFHARALRTPREVRHALRYVLQNARKHGSRFDGVDPFSSGAQFDGWKPPLDLEDEGSAVVSPRTWLLAHGWKRHGLVDSAEFPRSAAARSASTL